MVWRRLIHPRSDAVWNMAVDEAINAQHSDRRCPSNAAFISVGRAGNIVGQVPEPGSYGTSLSSYRPIHTLVRRITGGGVFSTAMILP